MVKILGICGSLREGSAHRAILEYVASTVPDVSFSIFEGISEIQNFNPDLDQPHSTADEAVEAFRSAVKEADAILICTPEYAYGIPGALKNALDWTVSSGSFVDKPVGLITASGLGEHGHASLLLVLQALTAKVEEQATLLIPYFKSKMNAENEITDIGLKEDLKRLIEVLLNVIAS
jgi:NAD(P)H-dependent FMN reductase